MSVRLLLYLRSNTFVQGQPPGCVVYTVPNIRFTEQYEEELKRNSARAPDYYVRAMSAGGYSGIEPPSSQEWANHPLLLWGAFSQQRFGSQETERRTQVDEVREQVASELIKIAQSKYPKNGVLWLAEASSAFQASDGDRALDALEIASEKTNWVADHKHSTFYIKSLFERSGFSKLDAAIEANNLAPDIAVLTIVGNIKRGLETRMTAAVEADDREAFKKYLALWQKLGGTPWAEEYVLNRFRILSLGDSLLKAMASSLGKEIPDFNAASYEERSKIKDEVTLTYLSERLGPAAAKSLLLRSREARELIDADRTARSENQDRKMLLYGAYASLSGGLSLFALAGLGIFGFLLLAVPATAAFYGKWPNRLWPWLLLVTSVTTSTVLFASVMIAMGLEEIGLRMEPKEPILNAQQSAWLSAFGLSILVLIAILLLRRLLGEKAKKTSVLFFGYFLCYSYLILIVLSAFFRAEVVEGIAFGVFR